MAPARLAAAPFEMLPLVRAHHPAFGHLPLRGRLARLAVEAASMLTAIVDRSEGFAQDDDRGMLDAGGLVVSNQ